jgi:hypothetical protein
VPSQPKPVSLEEVQDPEGLTVKPKLPDNDTAKPATSDNATGPSAPEENKDVAMTDAQPTVATGPSKPEPVPTVSEPTLDEHKTGQKRKADEPAAVNGAIVPETEQSQAPPEKKHKASPIKRAMDKVSSAVKKAGAPKKEKNQPAPVGRTARKTRSQGKADDV